MMEKTKEIWNVRERINFMSDDIDLIFETIADLNPEAVVLTGFDECVAGICNGFKGHVLVYNETKIIEQLAKEMNIDEAWEYYEYNILGAWMGDYTPIFLVDLTSL